jgi:anhydro-N-acetylmuramic acid kinase
MKKKIFSAIGLMSGTSMDGVDLSIVKSDGYKEISFIQDEYFEYDPSLYEQIVSVRDKVLNTDDLLTHSKEIDLLEKNITFFHAKIINQVLSKFKHQIDLIGFHGQTILHNPQSKITKQLGNGNLLSQLVNKTVVYDFRQADIENNGQGAPLTPIFHYLLANKIVDKYKIELPIGILNIGGISNVTLITSFSNKVEDNMLAHDIGPGNCLIDEWVRNNSKLNFDESGKIAKSGKIDQLILNQAIENFEIKNYSKALDTKDFDISFARGLSLEDGCATVTYFTAKLISDAIRKLNRKNFSKKYLLSGGGRKNNFLIDCIIDNLKDKNSNLDKIDKYEFNGDYIESQAFGYLAIRSYLNLPISFKKTTGCSSPTVGGKIVKKF